MPVRNREHGRSLYADVTGIGLLERDRNLPESVRIGRIVGGHVQFGHGIKIIAVIGKADLNRGRGEDVVQFVNQDAEGD